MADKFPIYDESGFPVGETYGTRKLRSEHGKEDPVVSETSGSELREHWAGDRDHPIPRHVHKNFNDPAVQPGEKSCVESLALSSSTGFAPSATGYREPLSNLCRHGLTWPHCTWCHSTETLREDQRKAQLDRIEAKLDSVEGHLVTMMAQMALLLNEVCKRPEQQVQEHVNRFVKWVP